MNLSSIFIKRPVATTLLTIGMALAGVVAFHSLPVSPLPQVDFPTLSVSAGLPGADPETMATSVAAPLERQFAHIAGVSEMTSTSFQGETVIALQFDLDRDIDGAARDVQAAISAARTYLPSDLPSNPTYRKVNPAGAPILIMSLTSDTVSRAQMYDEASTVLQQRISQVSGVGQVVVGGGSLPAVRVELNPSALDKYGIGLEDVRTMLQATNVSRPAGKLSSGRRTWEIQANDQLHKASQYSHLIVRYTAGAAVRLSDLGEVRDSVENVRNAGYVNGKPAVMMLVFPQPGANIIETVASVRKILPQLAATLPGRVNFSVVLDRTPPIRDSLREVELALIISAILVILVVFAFLRNARATLIPAVAVPVSLVSTFAVMYLFGYSLDNLSLMALTVATGFVVDDAIVVVENIIRYIEKGETPMEAAMRGAREITFTVISMSLSLVAVFIPLLMMGGMVGRLFREFGVTLAVAVTISLLVSLTLTPMMCARLLGKEKPRAHGHLYRANEWLFNQMKDLYDVGLRWALRHSLLMLALTFVMIVSSIGLYVFIPKGFFPEQDNGRLMGIIQAEQDISFQAMDKKLTRVMGIIRKDPDVADAIGFTGGMGATNVGRMYITLKSFDKRKASAKQVIGRLYKKLAGVSGAPTYLIPTQELSIGAHMGTLLYQYTINADSLAVLNKWAPLILEKLESLPQLSHVNSDQQESGLMTSLVIDRATASRLGINTQLIDNVLYDAFGQRQVSITYMPLNQYHVVMEVAPRYWRRPDILQKLFVRSPAGDEVPLSDFARYEPKATSLSIDHSGQFPSITFSFNLAKGYALGDAVNAIEAATSKMVMPATIYGSFPGTAGAFKASLSNQPFLIFAALAAVYIVLGILYESYIHPVTILSTLPSAGVGALVALILLRMDLTIIAIIGIILLIGLVKKNGILIVDFALEAERKEGMEPERAIYEASLLRFRPIMMTTLAALLGALPLALGMGVGSELRRPLGISIVGGLIFSQMLTLFTTPVIYLYMDRLRLWLQRVRGKGTVA
ncbi:MAG: multidrug efflux RND transporter permease subunit [Syntrophobacteraceae bacterium]|nr:multidrug efflux RND transporter permease subunit [Syntrophobacteraceae bacterium]